MDRKLNEELDIYHIVHEEHLKPKQQQPKTKELISPKNMKEENKKQSLRIKLLKHSVTKNELDQQLKEIKILNKPYNGLGTVNHALKKLFKFLKPHEDDGLCKRKSGFEIYCEMASIHGFINFVNAKSWQRIFWAIIIFSAVCMICTVLILSWLVNSETPTIFYTEGITVPTWTVPQPAITICSLNKISYRQAKKVTEKFLPYSSLSQNEMLRLFRFAYFSNQDVNATQEEFSLLNQLLKSNNYTIQKLLSDISPKCGIDEYRLCKWRSHHERCQRVIHETTTPRGICCSFNYYATANGTSISPEFSTSCGHQLGTTILLNPDVQDYWLSVHKISGYQVFVHESYNFPNKQVEGIIIPTQTESAISVSPRSAYGTNYLRGFNLKTRHCYFSDERTLKTFRFYSQTNCIAECRSRLIYEKCGCVPVFWPMLSRNWSFCQTPLEINCSINNSDLPNQIVVDEENLNVERSFEYNYICDCLPLCSFNQYSTQLESAPLNINFSLPNRRLFKGIRQIKNHVLLHVFFGDLVAERYRQDATEYWLSFVGTCGGIAGLYMGSSLVSIFEMIFFAFIRPLSNWFTKHQIQKKKNRTNQTRKK